MAEPVTSVPASISFLSELDHDRLRSAAEEAILNGRNPDSETIIQLMVYPLSYGSMEDKQDVIHRLTELTDRMTDDKVKGFILSGMMVFGDKVIRPDDAEEISRRTDRSCQGSICRK